ncbi:hypothetical protein [Flavobacterium sp.]|uniref:hypothetical protein n=1 Tax=Flavobacterium sp. TaxID=239 RepID=UPI00374CD416
MKRIKKTLRQIALMCLMGSFFLISIDSIAQRRGGNGVHRVVQRRQDPYRQDLRTKQDQQLKQDQGLMVPE